jgi:NhaP-type Na+/H+ and K+/H+ antiporter
LFLSLFVLGPGAGVLVGFVGVVALTQVRARVGVRRDYESLYSLGLAFAAFSAAEAVHGSGFLSAFAAGLTVAALDVELCDCFLEYGEVTAEMLLLLTFVLFGTSLIWTGLGGLSLATAAFAVFAILVRPPVYLLSLLGSGLDKRSKLLISWFGGRGLSSLLLVLLAVFAALPGSERIFSACCTVVLLSVVVHGGSPMALAWSTRRKAGALPAAAPAGDLGGDLAPTSEALVPRSGQLVTLDELRALRDAGEPVVLADVRTERTYSPSALKALGAVRLDPEAAVREARTLGLPLGAWVIPYCT